MLFEGGNPSLIPIEISPFILCFYVFKVYIYTPTPSTGFFGGFHYHRQHMHEKDQLLSLFAQIGKLLLAQIE